MGRLTALDRRFRSGMASAAGLHSTLNQEAARTCEDELMFQIKKILFPVDFSDACRDAARYVEAFAGQFGAEIMLLHVPDKGAKHEAETQLNAFLESELKSFTTHRVCTDPDQAPSNDPPRIIAETARSWNADLVMMPTHGLGFFRLHLLGSVTAKMLHDLKCPVWTSVHVESAPPLEKIQCRRVLCSVDLGESSRHVLEWAAWLAGEYQANLGIAHASAAADPLAAGWHLREQFAHYASTQAGLRIDALQREVGTSAQVFINPGAPWAVVAAAAREFDADLLVIGRHGKTGLMENLFPNATAILRESPCPVVSI